MGQNYLLKITGYVYTRILQKNCAHGTWLHKSAQKDGNGVKIGELFEWVKKQQNKNV